MQAVFCPEIQEPKRINSNAMVMPSDPVYIVDDESSICETVGNILCDEGYSVVSCLDADEFFRKVSKQAPALVLLDIWLPGVDGMAVLSQIKKDMPHVPVIMMSGHAGIEAAVKSIKLGAHDFLEKPLYLDVLLEKLEWALSSSKEPAPALQEISHETTTPTSLPDDCFASLQRSNVKQRTLKNNVVLNGTGLLSGRKTGIILSPLDVNSGVIFQTLDGVSIPGHITSLDSVKNAGQVFTANSTVLTSENSKIRTVEHLMGALCMTGITNVLIKADREIPNIDSSAEEFCRLIQDAGIVEQSEFTQRIVIHQKIGVGTENPDEKYLYVEPFDGFEVQMRVNYPAPIFEQKHRFNAEEHSFEQEIAPARSFNTFENIDLAQKQGQVGSGYLNSHIIMHDGKVINTKLRFPDEFVRHKILDLIGDLYLLGVPIQGKIVANMTSHGYNQALAQKIHSLLASSSVLD